MKTLRTDRDALREIAEGADVLGPDVDGGAWVLVRTTQELVDYLAHLDAEVEDWEDELDGGSPDGRTEDDEDNGDSEDCETGDCGEDDARGAPVPPDSPEWGIAAQDGRDCFRAVRR